MFVKINTYKDSYKFGDVARQRPPIAVINVTPRVVVLPSNSSSHSPGFAEIFLQLLGVVLPGGKVLRREAIQSSSLPGGNPFCRAAECSSQCANTLVEYMILFGADNRPPMLDKDLYDSWKSRMVEENGVIRTKKYAKLFAAEKIQADCDTKATNIIL
ncbi:hypothetical protein Tco_0226285 [Tanacetum coccineum]